MHPKLRFFCFFFCLLAVKDTNGMTWRNRIFALSSSPIPDSLQSALWFPLNYACGLYFSYQALPCCALSVSLTLRSSARFLLKSRQQVSPPPPHATSAPLYLLLSVSLPHLLQSRRPSARIFHPLGLLVVRVCSRILIGQFGDSFSGLFFYFYNSSHKHDRNGRDLEGQSGGIELKKPPSDFFQRAI